MDCLTRYHDFHSSSLLRACQNVMLFVSFSHLCFLSLLLYLICVFKDLFITLFRIFNFASHEVNNSLSVHFNVVHQWEVLHFQRMSLGLLGRQAPINPPFGRCWKGTPSHGRLDCYIRLVYCSILFFFFFVNPVTQCLCSRTGHWSIILYKYTWIIFFHNFTFNIQF